ncbi:MAG TPA: DinB family protein [Pyrinomonadaceae bacterium]|nr:DinB family protein [Pyrinomonadaceae bacterium]
MNDLNFLGELFRHMEWADSVVWTAVSASPEATDDATLSDRLLHIHLVQRGFLLVWKGIGSPPQTPNFPESQSLARWARQYYGELTEYLGNLSGRELARPLPIPWAQMIEARQGQAAKVATLGESLTQVVMHSTYHRGQVNLRLRELGCDPPLTDYIAWVWLGKPHPSWPSDTSSCAPKASFTRS